MNPQATPSTNSPTPAPAPSQSPARCIHRTSSGRRCLSEAVDSQASFCRRHLFGSARRYPDPSLASELLGPITEFQSASDVTDFLSRLLILQAQDRISPRRAATMAYTASLVLRGLRAMDLEAIAAQAAEDAPGQQVVFDLVRPNRDPVSDSTGASTKPS